MKLIVGLGNPGMEYLHTPHNAGFMAIDRIAAICDVQVTNRRGKAQTARVRLAGHDVLLAKPETFMNLSGLSVVALLDELELRPRGPHRPLRRAGISDGHRSARRTRLSKRAQRSQIGLRCTRYRRLDARPHRSGQGPNRDRTRDQSRRLRHICSRPCATKQIWSRWKMASTSLYAPSRSG